jgi:acetyltransferase-like isoleucine patch superfamily enzyme
MKLFSIEILRNFDYLISYLPDSKIGNKLRELYFKRRLKLKSRFKVLSFGVKFNHTNLIKFGTSVSIGPRVTIDAGASSGIFIGNNVLIASGVYIRSGNHNFSNTNVEISEQGYTSKSLEYNGNTYSIVIEDSVWIGANAILLSGSHIGKGSVLSAGSVISGKVPDYSIVVGNPGRVVGNRLIIK